MSVDRMKELTGRFLEHVRDDDVPGLAAQLAYRFLFAVFPFGLFVAALGAFVAGWAGIDNPADQIVSAMGDNLPPDIATAIRPELERVVNNTRPELVSVGALGALWAATGGMNALIKAMNRAYDVEEARPFLFRLGLAAGLTILVGAGILVSFVTIVGGALLTEQLARELGLTAQAYGVLTILRWPMIFALLVLAVAVVFRVAPNARAPWRWVVAGAVVFTIGWLVATALFAFYVANFGNYGATYGSLGGVIVLMLWFYLTGFLLVAAAELTVVGASVMEPEAIRAEREKAQRDRDARDEREARDRETGEQGGDGVRGQVRAWIGRAKAAVGLDGGRFDGPQDRRVGPPDRRRERRLDREPRPN